MTHHDDHHKAVLEHRNALHLKYGQPCPKCMRARPGWPPSMLLPQQTCPHDQYTDPRPYLTDAQWNHP